MARIIGRGKRKSALSKRVNKYKSRTYKGKYTAKRRMNIPQVVNKIMNRKIETKVSTKTTAGRSGVTHNNFIELENATTFFATTQGTGDPMVGFGQRIGDEITVKGIMFKMMLELDIKFSDVTARIMLIKSAKGDVPTRATLFAGVVANKMLDNFNRERYTIMAQKFIKLKASNTGTYGAEVGRLLPLPVVANFGFNAASDENVIQSRSTKIVKFYVPGAKFGRNGLVKYENASTTQVKFFDYTLVIYAYCNFSSNQDLFDVIYVNDYYKQMYYTDA
jgi:hypothetical protein